MEGRKEWFADWFSSPYYALLYRNRGKAEAEIFLQNILDYLRPPLDAPILDIACGSGRHAAVLAEKGYEVTGIDLSPTQIAAAKQNYPDPRLTFEVQDMRRLSYSKRFGLVLNLFTSFGYFHDDDDHLSVLAGAREALRLGGSLVLDYLNAEKIIQNLLPYETYTIDDVRFEIRKRFDDKFIYKEITVETPYFQGAYEERVRAFSVSDFEEMFIRAKMEPFACWGNYGGGPFEPLASERLVIFARVM